MRFLFRLLIHFLIFYLLYPSWEKIESYHFGVVTNSDALYPYLFAKEFWTSPEILSGWTFPPSNCFFPDVLFFIAGYYFTSDVLVLHASFAFFVFFTTSYFLNIFGLSRFLSLTGSIAFLKLGEMFPDSWGQFYLPTFHATEFFLVFCFLVLLKKDKMNRFWFVALFGSLLGLSLFSELWFLVHSGLILLAFFLFSGKHTFAKIAASLLFGFLIYKLIFVSFQKYGFLVYLPRQFPAKDLILKGINELRLDPFSKINLLFSQKTDLPLYKYFFPAYLILSFLFLVSLFRNLHLSRKEEKKSNRPELLYFCIVPLLSLIFLILVSIEFNARYIYALPLACFVLFFSLLKRLKPVYWAFSWILLIGILLPSHRYFPDPVTQNFIQTGKEMRKERLECISLAWEKWGKLPGASYYWPVKFSYAFSKEPIRLVPFTPDGIYYPWVHNRNWEKDLTSLEPKFFSWAVADKKDKVWNLKIKDTLPCSHWDAVGFFPSSDF